MNNDRVNEAYYGKLSDEATREITSDRIHWICSQVVGDRVLDVGCSQGITTILLARRGKKVFAVDRETPALLYARREVRRESEATVRRIKLLFGEGSSLPFPAGDFDCVVLGEVIEHVEEPETLVREIHRVLRPGGRLVLTTPFGLLPHEDHKRSLYVSSLLRLLDEDFDTEQLEIQGHHYLRVVAGARSSTNGTGPRSVPESWLQMEEEKFLKKETWYVDQRSLLRSRLDDANEKYREATTRVAELRALAQRVAEGELSEEERATVSELTGEARQQQLEIDELRNALQESSHQRTAFEERYTNAVRSFKKLKESTRILKRKLKEQDRMSLERQRRIEELQMQVLELRETARFRIGDAVIRASRSPREVLRLPNRLWSVYRSRTGGAVDRSGSLVRVEESIADVAARHVQFEREFRAFVDHVRKVRPAYFVVMFGGTTYIQDIRANRPIRLTRSLLEQRVPVLFNFHRWRDADHIPPYERDKPLLFQSPTDLTPDLVMRLLRTDLGVERKLFVVSYPHPSVTRLVPQLGVNGWATLYDCRDDWEEFSKVGAAKWYQEAIERYVVNHCDMSCCVSRPLQAKMASFTDSRPVRLSPNAFDPAFLSPGYRHQPAEQVTIGYFGHLTANWFDWESLTWIARQRPDWRFEIIGHGAPDEDELDLPANVELMGPRKHAEICEMGASWHVGIIPFKVGPLADAVDPIKIYEYFSLGLPVVSFRMPQIADYPYTETVETRESFVAALDRAVETRCEPGVLRDFLKRNTWRARARQMLDWTDEILAEPTPEKLLRVGVGR